MPQQQQPPSKNKQLPPSPMKRGYRDQLVRSLSRSKGSIGKAIKVRSEVTGINPLKPCGACMEWLRKIAEVQPDFKVVTFTDTSDKAGIYIESVI